MATPVDTTVRSELNKANPAAISDLLRQVAIGDVLASRVIQTRRKLNMDTLGNGAYDPSTVDSLILPDHAKATSIVRAYCRAATASITGELTIATVGVTPTTGQVGVSPTGNIVSLGTDAITNMDVEYIAQATDVYEVVLPVTSNAIDLSALVPANTTTKGVVTLLEAEALVGTVTGKFRILVPSASAATTGTARLDLAKATVKFYSGDAVTSARVKLAVASENALPTVLTTQAAYGG